MEPTRLDLLVIEDDKDDYYLLTEILKDISSMQFDISWISAYKSIDSINNKEYDVIISDYLLGEKTGLEVIEDLISNNYNAPVILLTGRGDHDIDVKASEAGAVAYLTKGNLTADVLERSIRYAIKNRQILKKLIRIEIEAIKHELGFITGESSTDIQRLEDVINRVSRGLE